MSHDMITQPITEPTEEQLRTLTGIIYAFRHRESGKYYIGQTRMTFHKRYGTNWHRGMSVRLKNAIASHGHSAFDIQILAHGIKTIDDLNRLEREYATAYNSYVPNGYNLRPCGEEFPRPGQKGKVYHIKDLKTGEILSVRNLNAFCRESGISRTIEYTLRMGRGHAHAGRYTTPETTQADINNLAICTINNLPFGPYTLWQGGKEFRFDDIAAFCTTHNLRKTLVARVLNGSLKVHKGFALTEITPNIRIKNHTYRLIDWNNEIHDFADSTLLRSATGVTTGDLHRLEIGTTLSSRGYSLISFYRGAKPITVLADPCTFASERLASREYMVTFQGAA